MASTVLPNGIIVPEKFSRDWYADLYHNWQELDNLLGGGTPKDGTLTIQKNGDTVGTFSANQATDETINITVPDVNDGTLTIQQNGTTVDTFTANSSSDKTVNIQCVDLTSNQTVGGDKEFTGTTTAHDLVPSATDTYNFGSSTAQWNNAYIKSLTINGVACGDILTHNASEFVDVSSDQIIDGVKTFRQEVTMFGRDIDLMSRIHYGKNSNPSATSWNYLFFRGNTATEGYTNSWHSGYLEQVVNTNGSTRGRWLIRDTSENTVCIELWANGSDKQVKPQVNNTIDLGTSANKWKSFNGINPGALSLPSNSYVNVDTTNWDLTCSNGQLGSFTPTANGWLMLFINNGGTNEVNFWVIGGNLRINNKSTFNDIDNGNFNSFTIPVIKGVTYNIFGKASEYVAGRTIGYCRFAPCQGNV